MTDPLRWHTEVRGRTDAEIRDRLALQDDEARRRGYVRVETPEPRQDGPETVQPLVYEVGQRGLTLAGKVLALVILAGIVIALAGVYRPAL